MTLAPASLTRIHDGPLPAELFTPSALLSADDGAISSFLGVVRNRSRAGVPDGPYHAVSALHYQCYRPMAEKILAALISEAAEQHDRALRASIVHAVGNLVPGEVSLAIHVASAHRAAAFAACRHLIERIKQDLPVWKHEHYADGTSQWLKGS